MNDKFGNAPRSTWFIWDLTPDAGGKPCSIKLDAMGTREAVLNDPDRFCYELPTEPETWVWDLHPENGAEPRGVKFDDADEAREMVELNPYYYAFRLPKNKSGNAQPTPAPAVFRRSDPPKPTGAPRLSSSASECITDSAG